MFVRNGNRLKIGIFFIIMGFSFIVIFSILTFDLTVNSSGARDDMVDIQDFIPGIKVELVYATADNVYGEPIYEIKRAFLRRGTAEKLKAVQEELNDKGLSLKIWDAYRPTEAQFKLWDIMPDRRFVVNPHEGFSYHSRGVAVDVTLVDEEGRELLMPSGFDDFTALADRDYSDVSSVQMDNAKLLENVMINHGFVSIYYEWWHFTDNERDSYQVMESDKLKFK